MVYKMISYLIRRIWQGLIVLLGVTFITFFLPAFFHNNIARQILGMKAPQFLIDKFNHKHGFDQPIWIQYFQYLGRLLHGNLGVSFAPDQVGVPVTQLIGSAIWRSMWLALVSLFLALIIAIPLGIYQAYRHNKIFDYTATAIIFILYSTPAFLLSILLMMGFSFHWHIFPESVPLANGDNQSFFGALWSMLSDPRGYALPVMVLTLLSLGGITRFMRGSFLDTLVQDYIRTAKAKGAGNVRILFRHAFRNAVIPIVTILGLSLPGLFGGALITETIFNFDGMGILTVNATRMNDISVVMGATLMFSTLTVLGNIIADLSLAAIDPRVRLGGKSR